MHYLIVYQSGTKQLAKFFVKFVISILSQSIEVREQILTKPFIQVFNARLIDDNVYKPFLCITECVTYLPASRSMSETVVSAHVQMLHAFAPSGGKSRLHWRASANLLCDVTLS